MDQHNILYQVGLAKNLDRYVSKQGYNIYIEQLFPQRSIDNRLVDYCQQGLATLEELFQGGQPGRIPGWSPVEDYEAIAQTFGVIPAEPQPPEELLPALIRAFFPGAVQWRSPHLMHNVGTAVNIAAAAIQALALDQNIYLINDDLAGNAIMAERAVSLILTQLAGLDPHKAHGVFTFGGTGTILYAVKAGTRSAAPGSSRSGIPGNLKLFITEDAHFSHKAVADWLGLGSENTVELPAGPDRRTDPTTAAPLLRAVLERGERITAIILNGGTTYDHAIDDIPAFVELRDQLVLEYNLPYKPHIHVDSVIGWAWLQFGCYDFESNPLGFDPPTLEKLATQYERIRHVQLADSWGVDFHKGVGGCPVDCSMVMMNDKRQLMSLSKKGETPGGLHQLADDFSCVSPVDYTLETSREAGKALAALAALHTLGRQGYQQILGNLVQRVGVLRRLLEAEPDFAVLNGPPLGYSAMVRMYAPELIADERRALELSEDTPEVAAYIDHGNRYMGAFFRWDNEVRMRDGKSVIYSFSKKYVLTPAKLNLSTLKIYPVAPTLSLEDVQRAATTIIEQKRYFDREIWGRA